MEFNITVPDKIVLKGELSERSISLENCHNQDEIIDYLNSYIAILHNLRQPVSEALKRAAEAEIDAK